MTTQNGAFDRTRINLALEASIHIGLAILLATACLLILRPFVPLLTWGIIIAVSAYPSFRQLQAKLGGRGVLTAGIFTLVLLALLLVPVMLLAGTLVQGVQSLAADFKDGTLLIPSPPASVENWPIIGPQVNRVWGVASRTWPRHSKALRRRSKRSSQAYSRLQPKSDSQCYSLRLYTGGRSPFGERSGRVRSDLLARQTVLWETGT